ncbi:hypothetical protein JQ633_23685 [Bradyrhizobium tropiciagri]|uniref:hypothetical protein n=1 Tax=Bradyrhizobium tropiciagri TaxID=312253 RepID=UPI001BAA055E|nr:hypothetical protein [Bradyrhizobium tropiciagri]MBR0873378.1 hypothetical protein [Bradyrhizobium tropiciagri]
MVISARSKVVSCMVVAAGVALAAQSAAAQQFSADLVRMAGGAATPAGHVRVSGEKALIETPAFPDGFFLVDAAKPAAWFVRPRGLVFMDARQSSPLTQMFVPLDPGDPCRQWLAMAQLASEKAPETWRCERDGEETIGGRKTDVYRVEAGSGLGFVGWVDRERRFPLQIKTADGTVISADHIRDEPQPAQSFEIPAGIRKFDPQALIRRIQQSDVWVAPPPVQ